MPKQFPMCLRNRLWCELPGALGTHMSGVTSVLSLSVLVGAGSETGWCNRVQAPTEIGLPHLTQRGCFPQ